MTKEQEVVTKVLSRPLVSNKRCSKASFSVLSQIYAKMWKAIFTKFFLILETKRLFHNLLNRLLSDFFRNKFSMFAMFFN
ncbi:hypothetical protein DW627_04000 [Enterococcus faecium]|nr:hypothetical protein [Enterococcus faecium]PQE51428.1 hypothetical protein CUS02_11135 [Enterococcus faecium]PQG70915.1 hypothetical protein CUS58_03890 [Enterococcus faecium]